MSGNRPADEFAAELRLIRPRLDVAALLIAKAADESISVDDNLAALDALADDVPESGSVDALLATMFAVHGFRGDEATYDDPRNSFLPDVLARRRGIPISLTVLLVVIGERVGVRIEGIGAPGHYLGLASNGVYIDAFTGDVLSDIEVRASVAARVPGVDPDVFLRPQSVPLVVERMLANLVNSFSRRADRHGLAWTTELQTLLPQATAAHRHAHALALGGVGRFAEAADRLDALQAEDAIADVARLRATAVRFRARLN